MSVVDIEKCSLAVWYSDIESHRCGYCKNPKGSISYGMSMHQLTVHDYQDLIDRGWRRSGSYCYKPIMNQTCCPQYTIKCDALNVQITKSQKKVIKKFNKFLGDGILTARSEDHADESNECGEGVSCRLYKEFPNNFKSQLTETNKTILNTDIEIKGQGDINIENQINKTTVSNIDETALSCGDSIPKQMDSKTNKESFKKGIGADVSKPPAKKAKLLRLERKKQKLLQRGMSLDNISTIGNTQKSLEQFLDEIPLNAKHKLTIKLEMMHDKHISYQTSVDLFAKYQQAIHNETLDECNEAQFYSFLIESPLKPEPFPDAAEGPGFGSFHQQYWLDDKLIAVGVIDILPKCISSVYFFYDPDYRNLTLGTLGSLRELAFTRQLNTSVPSITSYYMGYYIHSCPKMRYKGKLVPSYLLCPESYVWVPIEKCLPKLDNAKYSRLSQSDAKDENACSSTDVDQIKFVYNRKLTLFGYCKQFLTEQQEVFNNIAKLIGRKCLKNFIFEIQ